VRPCLILVHCFKYYASHFALELSAVTLTFYWKLCSHCYLPHVRNTLYHHKLRTLPCTPGIVRTTLIFANVFLHAVLPMMSVKLATTKETSVTNVPGMLRRTFFHNGRSGLSIFITKSLVA
jgi:hypothetical protein